MMKDQQEENLARRLIAAMREYRAVYGTKDYYSFSFWDKLHKKYNLDEGMFQHYCGSIYAFIDDPNDEVELYQKTEDFIVYCVTVALVG